MASFPVPETGILLTHFLVSGDIAGSRRFYADFLGGEVVLDGDRPALKTCSSRAAMIRALANGPCLGTWNEWRKLPIWLNGPASPSFRRTEARQPGAGPGGQQVHR
jgi:hypothetical protein